MFLKLLTILSLCGFCLCEHWDHSRILDNGNYQVYWTVKKDDSITFKTVVKSHGFTALALSTDTNIAGSDIMVGWIENEKSQFHDMHGVDNKTAAIDDHQDWYLLEGSENETHTILKFKRKLISCDKNDIELDQSTFRLIYAYTNDDPTSAQKIRLDKAKKGIVSVILLSNTWPKLSEGLPIWDAKANYHMQPKVKSMYWCTILKSPNLERAHIVKVDPVIAPGSENIVHHVDLRECNDAKYKDMLDFYATIPGFNCHHPYHHEIYSACPTSLIAYGKGGKAVEFPDPLGLDLKAQNYYVLEVHYDNAGGNDRYLNDFDNSGMNFTYTTQLRKHSGGVLFLGVTPNNNLVIPPQRENFIVAGHTKFSQFQSLPKGGIYLVSAMVHAHKTGRRITARHYRNNIELKPIIDNKHYDFQYQTSELLNKQVHILPEDQITVECTYNTMAKNQTTIGGHESTKEMCVILLYYYPRMRKYDCYSSVYEQVIQEFTGLDPMDDSFPEAIHKFDWTKIDHSKFQDYIQYTPHRSCVNYYENDVLSDELASVSYPENLIPYSKPDTCNPKK